MTFTNDSTPNAWTSASLSFSLLRNVQSRCDIFDRSQQELHEQFELKRVPDYLQKVVESIPFMHL